MVPLIAAQAIAIGTICVTDKLRHFLISSALPSRTRSSRSDCSVRVKRDGKSGHTYLYQEIVCVPFSHACVSLGEPPHLANERAAKVFVGAVGTLHEPARPRGEMRIGLSCAEVPIDLVDDHGQGVSHGGIVLPTRSKIRVQCCGQTNPRRPFILKSSMFITPESKKRRNDFS